MFAITDKPNAVNLDQLMRKTSDVCFQTRDVRRREAELGSHTQAPQAPLLVPPNHRRPQHRRPPRPARRPALRPTHR